MQNVILKDLFLLKIETLKQNPTDLFAIQAWKIYQTRLHKPHFLQTMGLVKLHCSMHIFQLCAFLQEYITK